MRFAKNSLLQPEVVESEWWIVDYDGETQIYPVEGFTLEAIRQELGIEKVPTSFDTKPPAVVERKSGFGARMSAPGYLDCTEWAVFDTEKEARDYLLETYGEEEDLLRSVKFEGYRLDLWDAHDNCSTGQSLLGYRLTHPDGRVLFEAEDYGCSPMIPIDSDDSVRSLLGFLTLRPGDTDSDYFDSYTPEQLAWAESEAETLQLWARDPDEEEEGEALKFEEVE
jgi:hypothetical protein